MQDILDAYASAADPALVAAYEQLSPEVIYEHVIDLFPAASARVADIGAGTGRDAAWLTARGHEVLAVEPVRQLREAGQQIHRSARIAWLDDRLPDLAKMRAREPFGFVLLGGVWQHLSPEEQAAALPVVTSLVANGGSLIMSLRHGPGVGARRTHPIDPDATVAAARRNGMTLIRYRGAGSIQPVNQALGVRWTWLAFEKDR